MIGSADINSYLKNITQEDFTAKEFRAWAGSVNALCAFQKLSLPASETEQKRQIVSVLDEVASILGNTRTVCKKYYVHPLIISLYENQSLDKYFKQLDDIEKNDGNADLTKEEKLIMKILESN